MLETDAPTAAELDAADPLARMRDRFVIDDPALVYLDGNSLGRLPAATAERIARLLRDEWGTELVRGWQHWLDEPLRIGDLIGTRILGTRPGEVVVADSTTVNLYRLAAAALEARPGRRTIVAARDDFPTDRYVIEGLAARLGRSLRWIDPDPVEGISSADVAGALDDDVALLLLSHVNYRSAAAADVPAVTRLAHDAGALVLWDCSHSAGAMPVELGAWDVDLAAGCTYKYLHGGPGSPAWMFVRRELQAELRTPIQGWFGQADQFAMGPAYRPAEGIRRWLAGTPTILALACVEEGVRVVIEAGIDAIRKKSVALTDHAIALHERWLAPIDCALGSPREKVRRGSHVAFRHPAAEALCRGLHERHVITDFRAPDSIRFGLSPLTTSFTEVETAARSLAGLIEAGIR